MSLLPLNPKPALERPEPAEQLGLATEPLKPRLLRLSLRSWISSRASVACGAFPQASWTRQWASEANPLLRRHRRMQPKGRIPHPIP
jgi:hypothetical protein